MKRILVVGDDSYIGMSFRDFVADNNKCEVTMVNSRDNAWKNVDFTGYDSLLHCAGIAHVKTTKENEKLYYDINCDLAVNVAKKAKAEGVGQFVFLSSLFVYVNRKTPIIIDKDTPTNPDTVYGKSKLKAEIELKQIADNDFKICNIRPPMVYGKNCRGNFLSLVSLAKKTPIFPGYPNKRSMIYVENLCNFICVLIDENKEGVFLPQNCEYVNTSELVKEIARCHGKKIRTIKLFNPLIGILSKKISVFNKVFGNLCYSQLGNESDYCAVDFEESVKRSVGHNG